MKTILIFLLTLSFLSASCKGEKPGIPSVYFREAEAVLLGQVMEEAAWAMEQEPVTVTAVSCERSAGGIHDFYSEGDYWWPDPENPEGRYIRRDGESNPGNFSAHRLAMIRFSRIVGSLASAYRITGEEKYARKAFEHIKAWFVDPATRMNPNLLYAQAIKGVSTGRGIGIIDTIHLVEVAQGLRILESLLDPADLAAVKRWFADYLEWLTTHPNGLEEMNTTNNHAVCWMMQGGMFAKLTGNAEVMEACRERFKTIILPDQMAADGSFPHELGRTKPYGYALFNLDAMASVCQILSTPEDNLWTYTTRTGRNMKKGLEFMCPYIADKGSWPYAKDVMYWEEWPVAHPALLFGAVAYGDGTYFNLWKRLEHAIAPGEVERNVPIRNPLIWID